MALGSGGSSDRSAAFVCISDCRYNIAIIDEMLLYASTSIGWKSPVTFLVACVVAMWLICNEIISILENIQDMGVNIPAFMQPLVKHIRSQVEDQVKVNNDSEGE